MIKIKRIFIFLIVLLFSSVQFAYAQPIIAQESGLFSSLNSYINGESVFEISFAELGFQDAIVLQGPYQEISTIFSLPQDWRVNSAVSLEMNVESEFQSLLEVFTKEDISDLQLNKRGILRVELNGSKVGEAVLEQNGTISLGFVITPDIFENNPNDIKMTISWDSESACQQSVSSIINISLNSKIQIPYVVQEIDPQLSDFPGPFYSKNNIDPSPMALILPNNPDEDEFSALVAVSAGFGKQTDGKASYEVFFISETTQTELAEYNLILIGKKDSLEQFFDGNSDQFLYDLRNSLTEHGNGSISVFASPWNSSRAVLIITGDDGTALQKASAAIAANDFLTTTDGNRANITEISDSISKVQWQIDHELGDLINEEGLYIGRLGKSTVEIPFYIPGDIQINPESYLELYYRHSQLINYLQSSITITLNDKVIGTIRFSDQSSSDGLARIILPPNSVRPLKNKLELTFTIVPQDMCADERSGNYWISIFRDSYLHLPPVLDEYSTTNEYYLGGLLNAFLGDNSLSNLIFVANSNDQPSWKYASKIAYELGAFSTANMMLPSALFPDTFKNMPIEKDTIMIGQTNELPFSSGINNALPLVFRSDGNIDEILNDGIQFEFNNDQSFGILEMLTVGNGSNNVLCVLGNSPEGLNFAFTAAKNRIVNEQGDLKNIEIIDQGNISHTFLIEQKFQIINEDELKQANWFDRLFELSTNRIAIYLLIGSILITAIFSIWALRNGSEKGKEDQ